MGKYDKFTKKKPKKNPRVIFQKANLYFKKFDYDNAIKLYRELLTIIPNMIPGMNQLGICYLQKQNYEKAKNLFLKVIKVDPSFVAAYSNLGSVFIEMQKYEDAKYYLKKAVKINPKHENLWVNLAKISRETSDPQNEIKYLEKVLEINPDRRDVMNTLSRVYENAGKYDEAIHILDRIEKIPSDTQDHPTNINYRLKSILFKGEEFLKGQYKDDLISWEKIKFVHDLKFDISPQLISKDERKITFSFRLKTEPGVCIISFNGQAILDSPNQGQLQNILQLPLPSQLAQILRLNISKKLLFSSCKKSQEIASREGILFPSEQELFSQLFKIELEGLQIQTTLITRPIIRKGDFNRLKTIPDNEIITEITLMKHPNFSLNSGDYQMESLQVKLEVSNKLILKIHGKILEPEYDAQKIPDYEKPIQPEIPGLVMDIINEIITQNKIAKDYFLKDTNWTNIVVNYKLKDEIITSIEYPKMN